MKQQDSFRCVDIKKHARPFGFQLVIDTLRDKGFIVETLKPSDTSGNVLMSMYWMEDMYEYVRWRKRNGIGQKYKMILGGNHATCYPNSVVAFADGVFAGDGELWDGSDDMLVNRERKLPLFTNNEIPKKIIYLENKSTITGRKVHIVELTRGCKNLCYFCQYAWAKPFRSGDTDFLIESVKELDARTIRLVSADSMQHPCHDKIMDECKARCIRNVSQDTSLLEIRKKLPELHSVNGTVRFGIDGMSERLRKKMHKPIGRDELIYLVGELYARGARRILAYNLFGVPGETTQDFEEYDDMMRELADKISNPMVMMTCWNAFMPASLTPLQWERSSWHNDKRDFSLMMRTREYAAKKKVTFIHAPMRTSPMCITKRVLAMRSTPATKDLFYTVATNSKISERQILKEFEAIEGYHLHQGFDVGAKMPWDDYIEYGRDAIIRAAEKHRRL